MPRSGTRRTHHCCDCALERPERRGQSVDCRLDHRQHSACARAVDLVRRDKVSEQRFNRTAARTSTISLSLAAIALIIPTVFHVTAERSPSGWSPIMEQRLSWRSPWCFLSPTFVCFGFSLKTHRHFFQGAESELEEKDALGRAAKRLWSCSLPWIRGAASRNFWSARSRACVRHSGSQRVFIGIIVVAIIGNAAEHSTAILMALKNKMDLSVGIAIGSSLQIALFVAPLLLFVSYFLASRWTWFSRPEVFAVVASVYILFQISGDGETNWMEGVQLLSVYVILGILFFYLPETVAH